MTLNAIFMVAATLLISVGWAVFESSIRKREYNAGAVLLTFAGFVCVVIGLIV